LERIINKTLEKDRELRYQSASDMRADLKRLKRESDSGHSAGTDAVLPKKKHRTLLISALAFIVVLALAVVGIYIFVVHRSWPRKTLSSSPILRIRRGIRYSTVRSDRAFSRNSSNHHFSE
jgi:hypothetical protein